jgi:hypothetical protein
MSINTELTGGTIIPSMTGETIGPDIQVTAITKTYKMQ